MQNVADLLVNRRSSTISPEEHGAHHHHISPHSVFLGVFFEGCFARFWHVVLHSLLLNISYDRRCFATNTSDKKVIHCPLAQHVISDGML